MFNKYSHDVHEFMVGLSNHLTEYKTWFSLPDNIRKWYLIRYCRLNDQPFVDAFDSNMYKRELVSQLVYFIDDEMGIDFDKVESMQSTLFSVFDHAFGLIINENLTYILSYSDKYEEEKENSLKMIDEIGSII